MNSIYKWVDSRIRDMGLLEMKLAQLCAAAATVILIKYIPSILELSVWWFILLIAICLPRLLYMLFKTG